ncbi:hypothetical protein O181_062780, partial [Austropuccinia psidii MF-1]|nr:hypothetical protein [Austropuccinia psidii MF-1]
HRGTNIIGCHRIWCKTRVGRVLDVRLTFAPVFSQKSHHLQHSPPHWASIHFHHHPHLRP